MWFKDFRDIDVTIEQEHARCPVFGRRCLTVELEERMLQIGIT